MRETLAVNFDDIIAANRSWTQERERTEGSGVARRGLAVLTCIDSRIDPLAMLGLVPGDAKIVRNAGARATDDAVRSLVLASHFLGVERIAVVAHTDCAMTKATDDEVRARLAQRVPAAAVEHMPIHAATDQQAALEQDVRRIRTEPALPEGVTVGGFLLDVHTGELTQLVR